MYTHTPTLAARSLVRPPLPARPACVYHPPHFISRDKLVTRTLRGRSVTRAVPSPAQAYFISRDELVALSRRHPETGGRIRQHAIWMALRRKIVALAKQKQMGEGAFKLAGSFLDVIRQGNEVKELEKRVRPAAHPTLLSLATRSLAAVARVLA